ncbi:MAG: ABC transporter ATP-binding protein/permease [Xylanivirga thermophila]|uniref:ATP-binding cassette domain-containing protein n=1 Tax=Xylanivirga thermophila TaxID=2496273 RepID=UPI0039F5D20A
MNRLKKLIYQDCKRAMTIPLIFNVFEEVLAGILTVYIATVFGSFADAIFKMDISYGVENIWRLIACIVISVFIIPLIGLFCNINMFKGSLTHDRLLYGRFLDKEYDKAMRMNAGEVQYRLEDDPIDFRYYWMEILTKIIVIPIILIYLVLNAFKISWQFTLITFIVSLIKLIVPIAIKKLEAKYDLQNREYATDIRAYETEITSKPYAIKMFGLSNPFLEKIDAKYMQFFEDTHKKDIVCRTIASNISSFIDIASTLLIVLIGATMVANGDISAGSVAAMVGFLSVFDILLSDFAFIIRKVPIMKNLSERLMGLYSHRENLDGQQIGEFSSLTASNLGYSYDDKFVFNNLNFKITQKSKTAICGENGSGKSTLIKVISGLVKSYNGSLKINDIELYDVSLESWREEFAYVMQEPYLFAGTVKDNIRLGNLNAKDCDVQKVMEYVGILYLSDRTVSMDMNDLSGGEKQRISIARALLKNTPILILDEPSNNLDEEGLRWLWNFIEECDKTLLFISHEKSIINLSDNVIYLASNSI